MKKLKIAFGFYDKSYPTNQDLYCGMNLIVSDDMDCSDVFDFLAKLEDFDCPQGRKDKKDEITNK